MDTIPCVSISTINEEVFVNIHQHHGAQIIMNCEQFSGLMYILKAVERQFIEDQTRKKTNDLMLEMEDASVIPYDPTSPEAKAVEKTLLEIYAMKFCEIFGRKILEKCAGCCMGSTSLHDHGICKLKKKEQINYVFDEVDGEITNDGLLIYSYRTKWMDV